MRTQIQTTAAAAAPIDSEREQILAAMRAWINQRPGLQFANYGDATVYQAEARSIARDKAQAETLLRFIELRESITSARLKMSFSHSFSGRLSWDGIRCDYCTGQYWPTEYRRAACAVLAGAIWSWLRDECMPAPRAWRVESWTRLCAGRKISTNYPTRPSAELELEILGGPAYGWVVDLHAGKSAGDYLRGQARKEFGHSIASRWFD